MTDVIVVGAGGHSKVVADAAVRAGFSIRGFVDDRASTAPLPDYQLIGTIADLTDMQSLHGRTKIVIAIGDNRIRMQVAEKLALPPERYATVIDTSAVVSQYASIAEGYKGIRGLTMEARLLPAARFGVHRDAGIRFFTLRCGQLIQDSSGQGE